MTVGERIQDSIISNNIDSMMFMRGSTPNSFFFSNIDAQDVERIIKCFKNKKCGLYSLPIVVLKEVADVVSPIVAKLINKCTIAGYFPRCLKVARVTPIYKNDDHSDVNNYRPISVLPTFSKIFEKVIYAQIYAFIEKYNILSKFQYGFRSKKSTVQAITNHLAYVYESLEQNNTVISIFLDFRKAFDCVDHSVLLSKLHYYGIRGIMHDWFRSYLSDREQFTVVGAAESSRRKLLCGVPQGTNLGPLLFLLFINDLPNCSELFRFTLFADDSTLTVKFSKHEFNITSTINRELINVNNWLISNKIAINPDKTKYIAFNYRNKPVIDLIRIGNIKIKETNDIKFLGIYLDSNLKFKRHVKYISSKIAKSIGVLNKLKYFLPPVTMRTLYLTFVQPFLLYAIQNWFSTYSNNTDRIIVLQKRAIRVITNSDYLAHTGRLFKTLNILKVDDMYVMQILVYMFKTIHERYDSQLFSLLSFRADVHDYDTRNAGQLALPMYRRSMSRFSLLYRGPALWNQLPTNIRNVESLNTFKNKLLHRFLMSY